MSARKFYFYTLKCLFFLACISILFSVYWLKPLSLEGSRITLKFIQNMYPDWDGHGYRFLQIPFQIPALIAIKVFPDIEPLTVARLYFYTLYIPVIFCISSLFLKLKNEKELLIGTLVFFMVFLPGMNFQLSHVNETLVIFILAVFSAYRKKFIPFILLSTLVISGHPAILGPFIILLIFFCAEIFYFKRSEYKKFLLTTFILIFVLIIKIRTTLSLQPMLASSYFATILNYFSQISLSSQDFISASYLLLFSIFAECLSPLKKYSKFIWAASIVIILFLISRHKNFELCHLAYQYRVYATFFFCLIMIYAWSLLRLNMNPASSHLAMIFIVIFSFWSTMRETISTVRFWKEVPTLIKHDSVKGCNYMKVRESIIYTSLPIVKIFLENKRTVESVLYSAYYDRDQKLCKAIGENAFPLYAGNIVFSIPIRSEGFFSILPMKNTNK